MYCQLIAWSQHSVSQYKSVQNLITFSRRTTDPAVNAFIADTVCSHSHWKTHLTCSPCLLPFRLSPLVLVFNFLVIFCIYLLWGHWSPHSLGIHRYMNYYFYIYIPINSKLGRLCILSLCYCSSPNRFTIPLILYARNTCVLSEMSKFK